MAREILFKAKRKDNGEWVEGYYFCMVHDDGRHVHHFIMPLGSDLSLGTSIEKIQVEIDINTLCQYTGLTDKNGNKIWENDVLSIKQVMDGLGTYYHPPISYPANVLVKWDLCSWMWETIEKDKYYIHFPNAWCHYEAEVIGNIFDNPELLGGADNG